MIPRVLLIVGMVSSPFAFGQSIHSASLQKPTVNHVTIAQDVVKGAFPELSGNVAVGLQTDMSHDWLRSNPVFVTIRQFDASAHNHSRDLLTAAIQITIDGFLYEASFFGDYIKSDLQDVFASTRQQKGDRAESVTAELKRRGVKYLPPNENQLIAALNLGRLSKVVGTLQQTRARLVAVPPAPFEPETDFSPIWIVDTTTLMPSGDKLCYSVMADPLSLRIRRIHRDECQVPK